MEPQRYVVVQPFRISTVPGMINQIQARRRMHLTKPVPHLFSSFQTLPSSGNGYFLRELEKEEYMALQKKGGGIIGKRINGSKKKMKPSNKEIKAYTLAHRAGLFGVQTMFTIFLLNRNITLSTDGTTIGHWSLVVCHPRFLGNPEFSRVATFTWDACFFTSFLSILLCGWPTIV